MGKYIISCLIVLALVVVPVAVMVLPDSVLLENERRKANTFPSLSAKMIRPIEIKKWFRGVDAYFADNFPLRHFLIGFALALHEDSYESSNTNACIRGMENWLFLGNNGAKCVDKLQGLISMSDKALASQADGFFQKQAKAKELGADFYILIGPNKSSIYPEYMPPVIKPSEKRFLTPLVNALVAGQVKVFDPTELLIKKKSLGLLYFRTDTHWNYLGAYEAYKAFLAHYGMPALPVPTLSEAEPQSGDLVGMGGYKKFPLSTGDNFTLTWNNGDTVTWENGVATNSQAVMPKSVWVFGDSFTGGLKPFIAASFRDVRFFSNDDFDATIRSGLPKPDVILWVHVERNFAGS